MTPEVRREVVRVEDGREWTPSQIFALVLGIIFAVLGGVALLRTGLGASPFEPTTVVAGLSYTPLLGLIEIVFGILLVSVGAFPRTTDGTVFLGALALVFGLLLVIEPDAFNTTLAAGRAHGWFYVITGGALAAVGLAAPAIRRRRAAANGASPPPTSNEGSRPPDQPQQRDPTFDRKDGPDGDTRPLNRP